MKRLELLNYSDLEDCKLVLRQILGSREKSLEPLFLGDSLKYQRLHAFHQTAHIRIQGSYKLKVKAVSKAV